MTDQLPSKCPTCRSDDAREERNSMRARVQELEAALVELHRMCPLYDSSGRKVASAGLDDNQVAEGLRIGDRIIRSILGETP